jgi:hypothetical protein
VAGLGCPSPLHAGKSAEGREAESDDENFAHVDFPALSDVDRKPVSIVERRLNIEQLANLLA